MGMVLAFTREPPPHSLHQGVVNLSRVFLPPEACSDRELVSKGENPLGLRG
jgi:hypothetical protein